MSVTQMITLSYFFFGIGIVMLIFTIVIYFYFDINRAWHITTGKKINKKQEISYSEQLSENILTTNKLKDLKKLNPEEKTEVLDASRLQRGNEVQDATIPLNLKEIEDNKNI